MIYFEVKDGNGKILAGNIQGFFRRNSFEDNKNFSENKGGKGLKGVYENMGNVSVWVVVEDEQDLLKSTKLFKKTLEVYKVVALGVYEQYKKEINAYAHALNTIQGQIRQKIGDFAEDKEFHGGAYTDSVKKISNIIKGNEESAADLICYLQKRAVDMRAHLLGAEIIHSGEQYEIKTTIVSLKRAILNQYTPFLEEFEKNVVQIKFFFEDDCKIEVDKNMFSLIMYNFFSNAQKYTKTNSEIRFHYSSTERNLDVSMVSLKMDKNELTNLHKDGIRGNHTKNIPGKGVGLFVIKKALEIMNKSPMFINPDYEKDFHENNVIYVENHFRFSL